MLADIETDVLFIFSDPKTQCTIDNKRDAIRHKKVNTMAAIAHTVFIRN